jgi:hypothetical protein
LQDLQQKQKKEQSTIKKRQIKGEKEAEGRQRQEVQYMIDQRTAQKELERIAEAQKELQRRKFLCIVIIFVFIILLYLFVKFKVETKRKYLF